MKNKLSHSMTALTILATTFTFGCKKEELDVISVNNSLTRTEATSSSSICSSIYITNQLLSKIMYNGTSVTDSGKTRELALNNPSLAFQIFSSNTVIQSGTTSVGASLPYGSTGSMSIPYTADPAQLSTAFFKGKIVFNPSVKDDYDAEVSYTVDPLASTKGEGKCGVVYFYTLSNYKLAEVSGPTRSIAQNSNVVAKMDVIAYDVAKDLKAQIGRPSPSDIQARMKKIHSMIQSISKVSAYDLAKDADVSEVWDQKNSRITWTEATAKAVALKRMDRANLPRSEALASAVARYVRSQQ